MASASVIFDVIGRDRNASGTFDKVGNSAGRADGKLSKFGTAMKAAAKGAGIALVAGVGLAAKGMWEMGKAAAADQQGQAKLALALKNTTGATDSQISSVEKWISAQGNALGVADDELRPALARLAQATGDVGKAQDLASLAMDVSAGSGKSLEQVSTALMKAQNGQVSALSRLGINTKNAKGETISFEQAQKRMAETFKGQAEKNANTLSGKMARLKLMMSEAGEEIGGRLIPFVTSVANLILNRAVPAIGRFASVLGEKAAPYIEKARDALGTMADKLRPVGQWFRDHPEAIKGAGIALGIAAVAAGALAIGLGAIALVTSPITLTVLAIAALGVGIALLWKRSDKFRSVMTKLGQALSQVPGMFMAKWRQIEPEMKKIWGQVKTFVADAMTIITSSVKAGVATAKKLWEMFGENVIGYLKGWTSSLLRIFSGVWDVLRGTFATFAALFKGDWKGVWNGLKTVFIGFGKILLGLVENVWSTVKFAFKNGGVIIAALWSKLWQGIKALAGKAWDGIKALVRKGWDWILGQFRRSGDRAKIMTSKLWDVVKTLFARGWDKIKDQVRKGWDWVVDKFKAAPGKIRATVGRFVDAGRDLMTSMFGKVRDLAGKGIDWLVDKIKAAPAKIRAVFERFREVGKDLVGAIANGIKNAAGFASDFAGEIWGAIKSAINAGIDELNNKLEFSFKVKGIGISVNAPDIGHLARGTNNWRGGLAVVGEEGPELVNLPAGARVTPHAQSMGALRGMASGSGGQTVVQLVLPGGRVIEQILIEHQRSTGRPIQIRTLGATG